MTSESTRFFGHPKETNPIFMGTTQCTTDVNDRGLRATEKKKLGVLCALGG
jgi:hypothetical protein